MPGVCYQGDSDSDSNSGIEGVRVKVGMGKVRLRDSFGFSSGFRGSFRVVTRDRVGKRLLCGEMTIVPARARRAKCVLTRCQGRGYGRGLGWGIQSNVLGLGMG